MEEKTDTPPADVNYMNGHKGGGKGDSRSKGCKGPCSQSQLQYHLTMLMKAMGKGGGKRHSKGNQKGKAGQSLRKCRVCYNWWQPGCIARNCPKPKVDNRSQYVPAREMTQENDNQEVECGTCVIDEVQDVDVAAIAGRVIIRNEKQQEKKESTTNK